MTVKLLSLCREIRVFLVQRPYRVVLNKAFIQPHGLPAIVCVFGTPFLARLRCCSTLCSSLALCNWPPVDFVC